MCKCFEVPSLTIPTGGKFICEPCFRKGVFYPKTECYIRFLLTKNTLNKYHYVYNDKLAKTKTAKLYSLLDVIDMIRQQFASVGNFLIHRQKILHKKIKEKTREKELRDQFMFYRFPFHSTQWCHSYIHCGEPSIEEVMQLELDRLEQKKYRRDRLERKLNKRKVVLNEQFGPCARYIKGTNWQSLSETVQAAELNYFFTNKTEYLKLVNSGMDKFEAKEMALRNYIKKYSIKSVPAQLKQPIVVEFD